MTSRVLASALGVLRRSWRVAFFASLVVTGVNTVPDVLRHVLVWDDPGLARALLVDVLGFLTALVAQVWLTGALVDLPDGGRARWAGALRRGTAVARDAVRTSAGTVLAGVAVGGGVSALVTLPASVAALGWRSVLGPLGGPDAGAFAVAAASDVVATALTAPFLAVVLVLVVREAARASGRAAAVAP